MTDRDLLASSRPAMAAYPHDQTDKVRAALEGSGRAPPIRGADPVGQFRGRVAEIQSNSTDLELVVFPEIYLCSDCDKAVDANDRLRSAAEPLDGPPGAGIGGGAAELGMWLIPGSCPSSVTAVVCTTRTWCSIRPAILSRANRKVFPWRPHGRRDTNSRCSTCRMPVAPRRYGRVDRVRSGGDGDR